MLICETVICDMLMNALTPWCFATAATLTVAARYVSETDIPKYIVSQPAIARCIESRSSRSPVTTSAPISRNACARSSSLRTIARTALPCFSSSSVTVRPIAPTRPAAPVTRMGLAMVFLPYPHLTRRSLDHREERLPFFNDIRGELRAVAAADVPRRVDRSSRDEQNVAGLEHHRRFALDLILERAFEDIDDLFAR